MHLLNILLKKKLRSLLFVTPAEKSTLNDNTTNGQNVITQSLSVEDPIEKPLEEPVKE